MVKKILIVLVVISAFLGSYLVTVQTQQSNEPRTISGLPESPPDGVTLDLSGKGLTSLSSEVTNRNDVKILNLSNNQLTTLPPEIGNMTNLEEINVENNRLVSIPPEIVKLTMLKKADFSNNRLTTLPLELGNLTGLKILNLSGYDSSKSDAQVIKEKLSNTDVKF